MNSIDNIDYTHSFYKGHFKRDSLSFAIFSFNESVWLKNLKGLSWYIISKLSNIETFKSNFVLYEDFKLGFLQKVSFLMRFQKCGFWINRTLYSTFNVLYWVNWLLYNEEKSILMYYIRITPTCYLQVKLTNKISVRSMNIE